MADAVFAEAELQALQVDDEAAFDSADRARRRNDYATAREYYEGRNTIAHGQDWEVQFVLPTVAQVMDEISQRWVTS